VDGGRHGDDAYFAWALESGKLQRVPQRGPIRRGVPLDEDQFRLELVPDALPHEAVDEVLHPASQASSMVVVARRCNDA